MSKSNVIVFPGHHLHRCGPECEGCPVCEGGLASCDNCGGAEGSMPTDCPQRLMTQEEWEAVYRGELDYRLRLGGWTTWSKQKEDAVRRQLT